MIQALYQALQISVSWERVSETQSIKETLQWVCSGHVLTYNIVKYSYNPQSISVQ